MASRVRRRPGKTEDWYSLDRAARIAGLTVHMLNYLCRHEVVTPSASPRRGRGRIRKYTFSDIVLLRVVARLLEQGISVLRFEKQCRLLKGREINVRQLLTRRYLVTDGALIYLTDNGVLERIDSGQLAFAFVLDLEPVRQHVARGLAPPIKRTA